MLPRELRWEEVAPLKIWLDTAGQPEPIADVQYTIYIIIVVKCHQNMFRYALYQINKLKLKFQKPSLLQQKHLLPQQILKVQHIQNVLAES